MPPTPDLSFTGLDEFVKKHVVENCKAKSSKEETKVVRKNDDAPIIEEWVSDNEKAGMSQPKIEKKIVRPSIAKIDFVKSKQHEKTARKTVKTKYEEIDEGYVAFRGNPKGGKITRKDHLGKFDGKADEGFFVRYSLNSKAFRVFNSRTRIVEENLHIRFSESTPNFVGSGPDWLFDIDALTRTMNYEPIVAGTQSNGYAGTKASDNADPKSSHDDRSKPLSDDGKKVDKDPRKENKYNELPFDPNMPALEDVNIFNLSSDDEDDGAVADMNNLDTTIQVSTIPVTPLFVKKTLCHNHEVSSKHI
nr:ribonuclease H-like domain-containing protein [Tanacetum cinerariifolium]